jgi:hypothetical protein
MEPLFGLSQVREAFEARDLAHGDRELSKAHQAPADGLPAVTPRVDDLTLGVAEVDDESHAPRLRVTGE